MCCTHADLKPSKTLLSSGSSSTPPLGHVKSCILWVLYNLLVKNLFFEAGAGGGGWVFFSLFWCESNSCYFSGAKHQDLSFCNFPFCFHLVTPSDSPHRDHLRCPPEWCGTEFTGTEGFLLLAKGYKQLKTLPLLPAVLEEQCHLQNKQGQLKTAMNLPPVQCIISLKLLL